MNTIHKLTLFAVVLPVFFTACQQPQDEVKDPFYPQTFSPVRIKVTPSSFDKARVTWRTTSQITTREFMIELSPGTDSLVFDNVILSEKVVGAEGTKEFSYDLENLWGENRYNVRVKTVAQLEGQEDSKWVTRTFVTSAENIFKAASDIRSSQLTLNWEPNAQVTKLIMLWSVSNEPEEPKTFTEEVPIGDAEKAAGSITLENLNPSTQYTYMIYNGDQRRGRISVTTKWIPANPLVVELGQDLGAIVAATENIGRVIMLPEGYRYEGNGRTIAGDMIIMGHPDAKVKPVIALNSSSGGAKLFRWPDNAEIGEIVFENIVFTSSVANEGGVFYTNTANEQIIKLDAIRFENCEFYDFGRTIFHIRTNTESNSIGTLSLNNCVAKNIGYVASPQAFIGFTTSASGINKHGIDNVVITNSTFQNIRHSFIYAQCNTTTNTHPIKNIRIENCTFYDFLKAGSATTDYYLIDGNNNQQLTITIKNIIMGKAGARSRHFRYAGGSEHTITGSFKTGDHVTVGGAFTSGLTDYGGNSDALWTDPENGDFRFKDVDFLGRSSAGDPRWHE